VDAPRPEPEAASALFALAQNGDAAASRELVVRHMPSLQAYVRLKAGGQLLNKESLSDLAQSACLQILEDLPNVEFRSEPEFRQWLFKHALHKIINKQRHYRAQRRDLAREIADDGGSAGALAAVYASVCTPSQHARGREALEQFEVAFAALPAPQQEAILSHRIMGLGYPEVAAAMDRSEASVRNLVYRGLAALSKHL